MKLLPSIQTAADFDIVLEVGMAQESNRSMGTKTLFEARLAAPATISRRLERLKKLGVIKQRPVTNDRRRRDFVLSVPVHENLRELARVCRRVLST